MNIRFLAVPTVAFIAGLGGGWCSRLLPTLGIGELRAATVRANRIELIDATGKTKAFIGTDAHQDTALVFLDEEHRERAKFGVWPHSYTPKLVMTGGDGNERLVVHLSHVDDRPMILLRDHERTRVHLGFYQNDAPSPKDEDWAIRFYEPHSEESLAAVGMFRDADDERMRGFLFAQGKDGQKWFEQR